MKKPIVLLFLLICVFLNAQVTLIGENDPHPNVNDGDFNTVRTYWRTGKMSPFWSAALIDNTQDATMGIHYGRMYSSSDYAIAESKLLNTNPNYQQLTVGDTLAWSFGADLEYVSEGTLTFSLVFGNKERVLSEKVKLIGSDKTTEHFQGLYIVNEEDAKAGFPFIRVHFYSEQQVKVWLDYVNIKCLMEDKAAPTDLQVIASDAQTVLTWKNELVKNTSEYQVYRKASNDKNYSIIATTRKCQYLDKAPINGLEYTYIVTCLDEVESAPSNKARALYLDNTAPESPTYLEIQNSDTEISIKWRKSSSGDVAYYSLYRKSNTASEYSLVTKHIKGNSYFDITPEKGVEISYIAYAHDYSGNRSEASYSAIGKTIMEHGASFRDLILPMPINKTLTSDTWGAEGVVPRDISNGIEHPDWTYWGGKPMKGDDGKYHMLVVRWEEGAMKGHWEWPNSVVVHSESNEPIGPYKATGLAYDYANGLGHNADVTRLNDGRYLLYSLINWKPTLFISDKMTGPWERLGIMDIHYDAEKWNDERIYQVERNLSGVQLEDGAMLFITKFGRMMKSDSSLLGPYKVLTDVVQKNATIPEFYRHSNYEDPCIWYDGIQFHCLINAFLDKRAIYMRSADGINWQCDPGVAYDPSITTYEDGSKTHWYKLERPHVLQDEYGRATHLSLAVTDVPKADDLSSDGHSAKNIMVPLQKHRLVSLLSLKGNKTRLLVKSEDGFNAQEDIDLTSLRFGATNEVNNGRGAILLKSKKKGKDIILVFEGDTAMSVGDFVGKLLGKTKTGELIVAYTKMKK